MDEADDPDVGIEPFRDSGTGSFRVDLGPYTTALRRPPSLTSRDGTPPEVVRRARDAIERGRTFTVKLDDKTATTYTFIALPLVALLVVAGIAAALSGVNYRLVVLILGAATMVGIYASFLIRGLQVGPARLRGTAVRGSGRVSTELWTQAVREVEAGTRPEDALPALHHKLMQVSRAEDKVNRLVTKAKYDADQSAADVARAELGVLVAEARAMLGLPTSPSAPPQYLANRWGESADLPAEGAPANPDDLR